MEANNNNNNKGKEWKRDIRKEKHKTRHFQEFKKKIVLNVNKFFIFLKCKGFMQIRAGERK